MQRAAENLAEIEPRDLVTNDGAADADALQRVVARVARQHALIARRHRGQHAAAHAQAIEQHLDAVGRNAAALRDREIPEVQPRVDVRDERRDARRLATKLVIVRRIDRDVGARQLDDEQADAGGVFADAGDDADQPAVDRIRDPELVRRALGKQTIAAVGLLLDVRLDLLRIDADADLREAERHRPAFGDQRQERALLLLVAVGKQRAGADGQLPGDLDREGTQAVRRQRFLDGGEPTVRRAGTAEPRGHGVAERFFRGDGAA